MAGHRRAEVGRNFKDIRARHFPPSGDGGLVFQVNSYTTNRQQEPVIGMNSAGEFVVTWFSYFQDGTIKSVFAQQYDSTTPPDLTSAALCGDTAHYAWARFEEPGGNTNIRYRSCTVGVWTDTRSGQPLPQARHSMDGGQTWLPRIELDP